MYVIMCEIREHTRPFDLNSDKVTMLSTHPIKAVKNRKEAESWMSTEPEIIVDYLNNIADDRWELGMDRNETHAQIWNEEHTIERMYIARNIR